MRIIWILFGLLIAIPLGALTWISSQVDADFLLETASGILEEEGISLTHTGETTFSLIPSVRLSLSHATLIIPESPSPKGSSPEQQISLEGFELTTNLFSFWHKALKGGRAPNSPRPQSRHHGQPQSGSDLSARA